MCAAAKGAGLLNTTLCEKYNELYSTSRQQRAHNHGGRFLSCIFKKKFFLP
jgi:hypothetical protein